MSNIYNSILNSIQMDQNEQNKTNNLQMSLFRAIENGTLEQVEMMFSLGASMNTAYNNTTALKEAMKYDKIDIFQYLIHRGVDVNYEYISDNNQKHSLIWEALWQNKLDFFEILLNNTHHNINKPERNQEGENLLIHSVKLQNLKAVEICLKSHKFNIDDYDNKQQTALHHAFNYSKSKMTNTHLYIIKLLLDYNANPFVRDKDGKTPNQIHELKNDAEKFTLLKEQQKMSNNGKKKTKRYGLGQKRRGLGIT